MNYYQQLNINQTHKQIMTPALIQSIEMLRLTGKELSDIVKNELLNNPVLEEDHRRTVSEKTEIHITDNHEKCSTSEIIERTSARPKTLIDHLLEQAKLMSKDNNEYYIYQCIITSLNDKGFLTMEPAQLANEMEINLKDLKEIINNIQHFDPVGCAAGNINDTLLIQARFFYPHDKLLHRILEHYLADLGRKRHLTIAGILKTAVSHVKEKQEIIRGLNPYPGRPFTHQTTVNIIPDIIISLENYKIVININDEWIPAIRINSYYSDILKNRKGSGADRDYIQKKIESARLLINNIHTRRNTILNVVSEIINHQADFITRGPGHLKHLSQKNIAKKTGYHESTVSRIINKKYVQTPRGTFNLKHFFVTKINSYNKESNIEFSSDYVKMKISDLVSTESSERPLNDNYLIQELKKSGISIARRTVSKYRNELKIPTAGKRKFAQK